MLRRISDGIARERIVYCDYIFGKNFLLLQCSSKPHARRCIKAGRRHSPWRPTENWFIDSPDCTPSGRSSHA